jgi:hypothetical protein
MDVEKTETQLNLERYPGFMKLMAESVRLEHLIKTAKTSLKKEFYQKKLAKNNQKVFKNASLIDMIRKAKAEMTKPDLESLE